MMNAFQRAALTASLATGVSLETITGPLKGGPLVARTRALACYLASTECGMSDAAIARELGRDRTTVTHALGVIENLREIDEIDHWIAEVTACALNPPQAPADVLAQFVALQVGELMDGERPRKKTPAPHLPPLARAAVEPVAQSHGVTVDALLKRSKHRAARNEAIIAVASVRSPSGLRVYASRRLAEMFGVHRNTAANAVRRVQFTGAGEVAC